MLAQGAALSFLRRQEPRLLQEAARLHPTPLPAKLPTWRSQTNSAWN